MNTRVHSVHGWKARYIWRRKFSMVVGADGNCLRDGFPYMGKDETPPWARNAAVATNPIQQLFKHGCSVACSDNFSTSLDCFCWSHGMRRAVCRDGWGERSCGQWSWFPSHWEHPTFPLGCGHSTTELLSSISGYCCMLSKGKILSGWHYSPKS